MSAPKSATEMPTRGIEPRTSGLQDLRSTTELYGLVLTGHAHEAKFGIYIHCYLPTDWSVVFALPGSSFRKNPCRTSSAATHEDYSGVKLGCPRYQKVPSGLQL